jgi:pyrroloquinoline quinone biosynthesis protein B
MRLRVVQGAEAGVPLHSVLAVAECAAASWVLLNVPDSEQPLRSHARPDAPVRGAAPPLCMTPVGSPAAPAARPPNGRSQGRRQPAVGQAVVMTDASGAPLTRLCQRQGGEDLHVYATPAVFEALTEALSASQPPGRHGQPGPLGLHWHLLAIAGDQQHAEFQVPGLEGLEFTAFDAASPWSDTPVPADIRPTGERIAIGVRSKDSGKRVLYVRGPGAPALLQAGVLNGLHGLLLDPGPAGDAAADPYLGAWLASLPIPRKFLLGPLGTGRLQGSAWPGVEVPLDGCEIAL